MQNNNDIPEWFLLDLPPINLYTANLLMPYYNGVEECRVNGIIQPEGIKHTSLLHSKATDLMNTIKGEMKKCVKECNLDKSTLTCTACKRIMNPM